MEKHEVQCSSLLKCFDITYLILNIKYLIFKKISQQLCLQLSLKYAFFEIADLHFSSLLCQLLFIVSYNAIFSFKISP